MGVMTGRFHLVEVRNKKDIKEFHELPASINKGDINWIKPLTRDVESVFNPSNNNLFRNGDAIRWLLRDDAGRAVGRVAAFYSRKIANADNKPVGGMGFFECIYSQEAASMLFDACRDWLSDLGMTAMEGPENFGERDRWWGLLVDGFMPPNYCMPYNPPYYRELFEAYGFRNYFEQYTYHMPVDDSRMSSVIREKAERIFNNPDYSFRYMTLAEMPDIARNFMIVYNKGWARFPGVKTISEGHARLILKSVKPVLDEKLLWFGFYRDEPVCFFIMLPEVNQIVRHLKGKMNHIGKLKFLWYRYIMNELTKAFGLIFGIVPEHQRKGVEGALIMSFAKLALAGRFPYKELEFNWIGDFNPSMMHLLDQIGATVIKTHITYRYLFDREAPFERAQVVNA
jgi:GNAT superfamily N-acetyltransferase